MVSGGGIHPHKDGVAVPFLVQVSERELRFPGTSDAVKKGNLLSESRWIEGLPNLKEFFLPAVEIIGSLRQRGAHKAGKSIHLYRWRSDFDFFDRR